MGIVAENAFQDDATRDAVKKKVFVQLEINRRCKLERTCGSNCFLVNRNVPSARPLSNSTLEKIMLEILEVGDSVGHFCVPGMEPLDTPDILFRLIRHIFDAAPEFRPRAWGIISNGEDLSRLTTRFVQTPLTWLIVSADLPEVGLRPASMIGPALNNAIALRDAGGCSHVCVNSVARGVSQRLIEIGWRAQEKGVEQWYLAPFRVAVGNRMQAEQSPEEMLQIAHFMSQHFRDGMSVLVEVDYKTFLRAAGGRERICDQENSWRLELQLDGTGVRLMTLNPRARIVRVRWDGAILGPKDFYERNLAIGEYGFYEPGRLAEVIMNLAHGEAALV